MNKLLDELISSRKLDNLGFLKKVKKALKCDLIDERIWIPLKRLDELRNELAHHLNAEFTRDDVEKLVATNTKDDPWFEEKYEAEIRAEPDILDSFRIFIGCLAGYLSYALTFRRKDRDTQ